jgi:hypothetical protein
VSTDISVKPYILGKLLQGILAGIYTVIGIKTAGPLFIKAEPAFLHMYAPEHLNWQDYFFNSCKLFSGVLIVFAAGCILSLLFNRLAGSMLKKRRLF